MAILTMELMLHAKNVPDFAILAKHYLISVLLALILNTELEAIAHALMDGLVMAQIFAYLVMKIVKLALDLNLVTLVLLIQIDKLTNVIV